MANTKETGTLNLAANTKGPIGNLAFPPKNSLVRVLLPSINRSAWMQTSYFMEMLLPVKIEGELIGNPRQDNYLINDALRKQVVIPIEFDQGFRGSVSDFLTKIGKDVF